MKNDNQTTDMFDEVIGAFTPQPLEVKPAKPKRIVIKKRATWRTLKTPVDRDTAQTTKPRPIVVRAVEQALATLGKLGCVYHAQFNGKDYTNGQLVTAKLKRAKRASSINYGSRAEYYKPFIKDLQPGDVVDVPFGDFYGYDLQSSIGAWAVSNWGTKSFMTTVNKKTKVVEVLRLK
jgi:hypothetical protein